MQTNHKPKFDVGDEAVKDRIRFTSFLARFVSKPIRLHEKQRDIALVRDLETTLLDAVFSWVLQGAIAWYKDALGDDPEMVRQETDAYVNEVDDVGASLLIVAQLAKEMTRISRILIVGYAAWRTVQKLDRLWQAHVTAV